MPLPFRPRDGINISLATAKLACTVLDPNSFVPPQYQGAGVLSADSSLQPPPNWRTINWTFAPVTDDTFMLFNYDANIALSVDASSQPPKLGTWTLQMGGFTPDHGTVFSFVDKTVGADASSDKMRVGTLGQSVNGARWEVKAAYGTGLEMVKEGQGSLWEFRFNKEHSL